MIYQSGDLVFDKYRIELFLGQGSLGEVYRITNLDLNAPRVIKVLKRDTIGTRSIDFDYARQCFKIEDQLGASLNRPNPNPHLLQVYEFVETKDELLLEMQYAQGGNLTDRMLVYKEKCIPFPKDKALRTAFEIALSLSSLHALKIVYRNLKPENILFDQRDQAILADFGSALIPGATGKGSLLVIRNPRTGPTGYMSPEQRKSPEQLVPSSDIYSLGLVLFEMLTGKKYYSVGHRNRLRDAIPGIKLSLDDLMARMLSENPGSRPQDGRNAAVELYRELELEEQAQRDILAKKQQELEEWERLKNEELAKLGAQVRSQKVNLEQEINESAKQVLPEIQEPERLKKEELQESTNTPEDFKDQDTRPARSLALESKPVEEKEETPEQPAPIKTKQTLVWKKYWYWGVIILVGLAIIPIIGGIINSSKMQSTIGESTGLPKFTSTLKPFSTPIPSKAAIVEIQSPIPSQIPTEEFTHIPAIEITQTQNEGVSIPPTPMPSDTPVLFSTLVPTQKPAINLADNPTLSPEIIKNPSFEEDGAWINKSGEAHIVGQYSSKWASQGTRSYQFSLFGNEVYEYCFIPGMRTTTNQNVDLTDVNEIVFDLNIRPAIIQQGFHGDKISIKTIAFIDGDQVFLSSDSAVGENLNQKILLNKKYSGRHEIKFGLMVASKFCVKGKSEGESLLVFLDNIRFAY